jgi:glycosyltransferase involved in cell wall biosynthesis
MSDVQIAVVLMVKNEEKRIEVSLDSVKNEVDGIILFDTGSTDNTVNVVKKYAKKNNLHLHLIEGVFEDFSTSRNKMLEYSNSFLYDYLILFDCNDELKIENASILTLKELLENEKKSDNPDAFLIHQKWYIGPGYNLDYYNIKIIKPNLGFKYKGSVHEYIETPKGANVKKLENLIIFQDRAADNDGKTFARWEKDLVLLQKDLKKNPNDGRTQYYLAQTLDGLGRKEEAFEFYKLRANNASGFYEERFLSMMNCGNIVSDQFEKITWYLKAFEINNRAEPLVEIAKIYRIQNQFYLSYIFAKPACDLTYPSECLLQVNKRCYSHDRWHELSIVCYYLQKYKEGKEACQKALDSGFDEKLNKNNMDFYLKLEKLTSKCVEKKS